MAQAKITIDRAQAASLMCLVHRKKPVYPIMYEPMSGVNLYETKGAEKIEVPDSADLFNLKRFYEAGYFTVVEGKIADVTKFTAITVDVVTDPGVYLVELRFDQPVYITTGGINDSTQHEFELKLNGSVVPMGTIGAIAKSSATKTISFDIGVGLSAGDVVSFELKAAGAAKILDVGDVAVAAKKYTFTV